MSLAKNGDTVKVHYVGKLKDGSVFSSNMDNTPLQFKLGKDKILNVGIYMNLQETVVGMKPGESKTVVVPTDKAFGPHHKEMIHEVQRNLFRDDLKPETGEQLEFKKKNGDTVVITVLDVTESSVTIDTNHPLAGKDLTFEILLEEII